MTNSRDGSNTSIQNDENKSNENLQNSKKKMNKNERVALQYILVEYIENPRKMGGCILNIEELFRKVHERWSGYNRHKDGGSDLAQTIIAEISDHHRISIAALLGPTRSTRIIAARTDVIIKLIDAGFTHSEVARSINKHPSTVAHTLAKLNNE